MIATWIREQGGFPENLHKISFIKPSRIPLNLTARLKCQNCGLWKRGILCPPYLWQTYPQFKTQKSTREFLNSFKNAVIFIWKNDGTKSWKFNKGELSHIKFGIKKGKQLKGTEAGQSRELCKIMRKVKRLADKEGYDAFAFVPGHCDACAFKCPNRDNPPCKHEGLPSMESIGIDVYKLLEKLDIKYEYPVVNYLTNVTMLLMNKKK